MATITVEVVERASQAGTPYRDVYLRHPGKPAQDGCVGLIRLEPAGWREHSYRPARHYGTPEAAALALAGDYVRQTGGTFCGDAQAP